MYFINLGKPVTSPVYINRRDSRVSCCLIINQNITPIYVQLKYDCASSRKSFTTKPL